MKARKFNLRIYIAPMSGGRWKTRHLIQLHAHPSAWSVFSQKSTYESRPEVAHHCNVSSPIASCILTRRERRQLIIHRMAQSKHFHTPMSTPVPSLLTLPCHAMHSMHPPPPPPSNPRSYKPAHPISSTCSQISPHLNPHPSKIKNREKYSHNTILILQPPQRPLRLRHPKLLLPSPLPHLLIHPPDQLLHPRRIIHEQTPVTEQLPQYAPEELEAPRVQRLRLCLRILRVVRPEQLRCRHAAGDADLRAGLGLAGAAGGGGRGW